jgi:putative transposase
MSKDGHDELRVGEITPSARSEDAPHSSCRGLPLEDGELQSLFERLNVPDQGRARIRQIRDNPPHRAVRSNKMSGKTRYAPLKMPFVVEVEATSTEYVAAVEWDHDLATLEFYPQVEPLKVKYRKPGSSRLITALTTPDFLRITKTRFAFVECKREEELVKLAKESPARYKNIGAGLWRSPPAEEAAAEFGCGYQIRSSAQNNWTLHENLELLKDYLTGDPPPVSDEHRQFILDRLKATGWISVFDLVHMEPSVPADAVYTLLAQRAIYFPILEHRLSNQERAFIFRDEATFHAYRTFLKQRPTHASADVGVEIVPGGLLTWDGVVWQIINQGKTHVTMKRLEKGASGSDMAELQHADLVSLVAEGRIVAQAVSLDSGVPTAEAMLKTASPKDLRLAQWRYEIIEEIADPSTNPLLSKIKRRTKFNWKASYRAAEIQFGNGFVGLFPKRGKKRAVRASPRSLELARETIANDWETIRNKRRFVSWGRYRVLAYSQGLTPVSYVTFCSLVKGRHGHAQTVARVGEKAAYDLEPQFLDLEWTTPRHGVRPWHIAHIDHTPLPLKFVHSKLAGIVDTIWLTFLTDANTRKVLAFYLSFDPPSYRSCMMVLRDCVRRYNRVPQIIVSDQGSDFKSTYWETQLALLCVTKRERKAGKPRGGSTCERMFNTAISQFVSNLMGSTDVAENHFRRVSPEVDPSRHAVWTLERFNEGMQKYLDEVFHVNHHAGLGMSPNEAWALGIRSHGERCNRLIPYDQTFIAQSCPAAHRGLVKVTAAGVKINYRWFKCEAFLQPGVLESKVHARYDPFNAGLAYVLVNGLWHTCYSEHYAIFSQYSERAIWLVTERLKLIARSPEKNKGVNAERLALFLQGREADEDLANQLQNDEEARPHRDRISKVDQPVPQPSVAIIKRIPTPVRQLEDL